MSNSVFYRNKTRTPAADTIISKMGDENNPDMDVQFKGFMHGGKGFALEVSNLEQITEYTTNLWTRIIEGEGLTPSIVTNMMSGTVKIQCTPEEKRQGGRSYLNSFMYLSLTIIFIYSLWTRHRPL